MKKIIVANWKMNTGSTEAESLVKKIIKGLGLYKDKEIIICPPFMWLSLVRDLLNKKSLKLGAQNVYFEDKGSFTGEISPLMLKEIAEYVIIGHSERRRFLHENDEMINKKVQASLKSGLKPIVCVGEFEKNNTSQENELYGNIFHQLTQAIAGVSGEKMAEVIVAYEPVWAIGSGTPATVKYVSEIVNSLRDRLAIIYNREIAQKVKILYGGSVDSSNVGEFFKEKDINGVLVGGASLKAEEFIKICKS